MKTVFCILTFFYFTSALLVAQDALELKKKADLLYKQGDFESAEEQYRKSIDLERRAETLFNLGNSLYQLERYEEAARYFSEASEMFQSVDLKSDATHNLGNTHFERMDLDQAINAYRQSLVYNPANVEARNNYLLAKELLSMLSPQTEQDRDTGDQPPPHEEGDENQETLAEGQMQDEEMESNGESDDGLTEQSNMEDPAFENIQTDQSPEPNLNDELLEQLLQLAEEEDQRTQRKMNEQKGKSSQVLRDW